MGRLLLVAAMGLALAIPAANAGRPGKAVKAPVAARPAKKAKSGVRGFSKRGAAALRRVLRRNKAGAKGAGHKQSTKTSKTPAAKTEQVPEWKTINPSKTQQKIAVMPDPQNPGQMKVLKPTSKSGGYYGTSDLTEAGAKEVMRKGFRGNGNSIDLLSHAEKNGISTATGFRGTTELVSDPQSENGAAYWASKGGWVVEIRNIPTWDVNKTFEGRIKKGNKFRGALMSGEREMAVPRKVHPWQVKRVGQVEADRMGRLKVTRWIDNPNYGKPENFGAPASPPR